jgi:hypothetical protein
MLKCDNELYFAIVCYLILHMALRNNAGVQVAESQNPNFYILSFGMFDFYKIT